MISRRGFLKGLVGLAAAPAICKAENLMKIFVPPQELIIPDQKLGRGMTECIVHIDEAAFMGDYDGDVVNYNIVRLTEQQTQSLLSTKHMCNTKADAAYIERNKALREFLASRPDLNGKTLLASRSPSLVPSHKVLIRNL